MEQEVQIVYKLIVPALTEGDVTIYTPPKGWDFLTESIGVAFDPATDYDLEVSFWDVIKQVAPTVGVYVGKAFAFNGRREIKFEESSKVILHYKNTNLTTARTAVIEIMGVLKSE